MDQATVIHYDSHLKSTIHQLWVRSIKRPHEKRFLVLWTEHKKILSNHVLPRFLVWLYRLKTLIDLKPWLYLLYLDSWLYLLTAVADLVSWLHLLKTLADPS